MRKAFLLIVAFSLWIFLSPSPSLAAPVRYATCDACGLCPKIDVEKGTCTFITPTPGQIPQVPGDWKRCVKCLYPALYPDASNPDPTTCDTLKINPDTNVPVYQATAGRQFTMLGCLTSGTSVGFTGQTGAPTFVQALLNIVFSIAGGLAFLYLMYGGFIILTSQADPERLNYGRRLIYGAIAGLIITISSVFLVNLIGSGILRIPGFNGATTPTPVP